MGDDSDKVTLEELVSIEENVIGKPCTCRSNQTGSEVAESELQRLSVVAGHLALLLCHGQLSAGGPHLEGTVVDEPKGSNGRKSKGNRKRGRSIERKPPSTLGFRYRGGRREEG